LNILCAGIPRSGSTWLFNVLRTIFLSQGKSVCSGWNIPLSEAYEVNIVNYPDPKEVGASRFTLSREIFPSVLFLSLRALLSSFLKGN